TVLLPGLWSWSKILQPLTLACDLRDLEPAQRSGACSPRLPRIARQVRARLRSAATTGVRPRRAVRLAPVDSPCESRSRIRSASAHAGWLPGRGSLAAPRAP